MGGTSWVRGGLKSGNVRVMGQERDAHVCFKLAIAPEMETAIL